MNSYSDSRRFSRLATIIATSFLLLAVVPHAISQPSLYWTTGTANKIQQFNLTDKVKVQDLVVAPLASPGRVWLDSRNGSLYWNSLGRNQIRRASLDGSRLDDLLSGQLIELDVEGGWMYLNRGDDLFRAKLDGTAAERLMTLQDPVFHWSDVHAAVDVIRDEVYWCSATPHGIHRSKMDGTGSEVIHQGDASDLMIDPIRERIYWSTSGPCGNLISAKLDGTGVQTVISGCVDAAYLDRVNARLYWAVNTTSVAGVGQELFGAELDGSNAQRLFSISDWHYEVNGLAVDPDRPVIYWTSNFAIRTAGLSGTGRQNVVNTDMFAPRGLAIDAGSQMMYWSSVNTIHGSDLFGQDKHVVVDNVENWVYDVAVDPVGERLYWVVPVNADTNRIQRTRLNGWGIIEDLVMFSGDPFSLVLDSESGLMYWTDGGAIVRADLNGSNATQVVDRGQDVDFHDIVLDSNREWVYWTAGRTTTGGPLDVEEIGRSRLDTGETQILFADTYSWWGSIVLDQVSEYVYWAVTRHGTVWRAPAGRPGKKEFVASVNGDITSLALGDPGSGTSVVPDEVPYAVTLHQNYPNPLDESTVIRYQVGDVQDVRLVVHDVLGREVATLVDRRLSAGSYAASWTPRRRAPAGVYFYTLTTGNRSLTRTMIRLD